jgi:hypothetical protein
MLSKLLSLVRQAVAKLQSGTDHNRSEVATRDAWLEQISDFQWIDDESDRAIPPEEKKGWFVDMFGSTSPVHDDSIGANMADWDRGPSQVEEPPRRSTGQGMLLA